MEKKLKAWLKQLKIHESTISMALGALVVIVVGTLMYQYFNRAEEQSAGEISSEASQYTLELSKDEEGKYVPTGLPFTHTVKKGDHLWSISTTYYGNGYNWTDIAQANNMTNPGIIIEGQQLVIPKVELRVPPEEKVIAATTSLPNTINDNNYEVIKGDTLWDISVRAYQDGYRWIEIYKANAQTIQDPNIIEIGMTLIIPRG
jgi:nucleoid-associated protein YgaU